MLQCGGCILTSIVDIVALSMLMWLVYQHVAVVKKTKRAFFVLIIAVIVGNLAEMTISLFNAGILHLEFCGIMANIIWLSLLPLLPIMCGLGICEFRPLYIKLLMVPGIINAVMVAFSVKYGFIFSVGEGGVCVRGSWFFVFEAACVTGALFLLIKTIKSIAYYVANTKYILLMVFIFQTVGTCTQIIFPHLHTAWLCITFSVLLYFAYYVILLSSLDILTSLFNFGMYESRISEIDGAQDASILYFKLCGLGKISEQYGDELRDRKILDVSNRVKDAFSRKGLCYRIEDDEFCVISKELDMSVIDSLIRYFKNKISEAAQKTKPTLMYS